MTAGIPGTGIGGIFYILLVALMPLRELYLTLRGRSSLSRWETVLGQWSICAGILAALWAEAWLLSEGFAHLTSKSLPGSAMHRIGAFGTAGLVPALVPIPFVVLGVLVAGVHVARLILRGRQAGARDVWPTIAPETGP